MKGNRILLSFWLASAVFCLLQLIYGPNGWFQTAQLERQYEALSQRVVDLEQTNRRLSQLYEALRTSPEAIRLEARQLGYFQAGETPVRVLVGSEFQLEEAAPDLSMVTMAPLSDEKTGFFRTVWFLLFGIFYLLLQFTQRWMAPAGARSLPSRALILAKINLPVVRFRNGLDFFRK